jgi:uncharacterized protein
MSMRHSRDLCLSVRIARTFAARCIGLLDRGSMEEGEGLLFAPGGSIHTLGMRFPIDIVFLDAHMRVLAVAAEVKPWRFAWAPRGTRYVLELVAGRAARAQLDRGAIMELKPV